MATKFNIKRVVKELKDLELDPPAGIICYSKDDSLKELEASNLNQNIVKLYINFN
jgi:ubiquitin-protein ligase